MRLAHNIFARKLVFADVSSSVCINDVTIFENPPHCTILLVVLLCSSQNAMSEFAAFFRSFHFHWSRWSGIIDSILGASIQTCALAFSHSQVILYLPLRSPHNMLFLWLQHDLPHSMNVCVMLDWQYVLSGQHCFHPLAIFPMNRCPHPIFICCWNTVLYCWGIVSSSNNSEIIISILDPLGFSFHSSLLCISPYSSASSIPASNRCSRWFGASISLIRHSNVVLCSLWTSFLLEHRRMCRIVVSSLLSQLPSAL